MTALALMPEVDESRSYVVKTLRRLGVSAVDAEDVAHDVLVVALKREASRAAHVGLRPWLFTIAHHEALHHFRRRKRSPEVPDAWPDAVDPAKSPETAASEAQQLRALLAAFHGLSEERQAVFLMHDVDGCTAPEIAAALGVPLNTVYSRLRLARAQLVDEVAPMNREKEEAPPPPPAMLLGLIGFLQAAPGPAPAATDARAARIEKGAAKGFKLKLIAGGLMALFVALAVGWQVYPPCGDGPKLTERSCWVAPWAAQDDCAQWAERLRSSAGPIEGIPAKCLTVVSAVAAPGEWQRQPELQRGLVPPPAEWVGPAQCPPSVVPAEPVMAAPMPGPSPQPQMPGLPRGP